MSLELQVHAQLLGLRVSDNHCECIMSAWLQERTTIAHPIWMLGYRHEPPTLHAQWVLGHWFQSHIDCYQGVLCYRDEPPIVYAPRVLRYRCEPPSPEAPWGFCYRHELPRVHAVYVLVYRCQPIIVHALWILRQPWVTTNSFIVSIGL